MKASDLTTGKQRKKAGRLLRQHRRDQPAGWRYEILLALLAALAAAVALAPQVFAVFTPPMWVRIVLFVLAGVLALTVAVVRLRSTQLGRRPRFAGRGRERSWWLLLAVVLFAALWAIAQVLGWPVWARAALAGLAAAAPLVISELRARAGQDDTLARLVERWVAVSAGHGRLLRVRDVGLDQLRVHAARVQVPYIERDQQDKLEEAVGPGQAVLVVGHSMSGKTRLAAEAVKQKFPEALLLPAESGKALRELFDGGLDPAGIVVWLDDLERFLGTDGLTVGLLNRLTTARAIVVATIRVGQWETYRPRDELRPQEWEVLQRFSGISLQRRLTGPELGRVRAMVNDPGVLAAVDHYGLAEYLGAGPEALDKFEKGEIANPVGYALVRAAVDWRRTGFTRPVSQQVLASALPTYLADRPDVPRTNQAIDEGLAWATAKINETVALLGQVFAGSNGPVFEAFDYLIDQLTPTSMPVPDLMWALALEQAESAELTLIGIDAYQAGRPATAETAWRRAIDSGGAEQAPTAAIALGQLLREQGDLEGARAAYRQAIASGHAEWAPPAANNLGLLLREQGDLEEAKAAYGQAIASGHAEWAPVAVVELERLLRSTPPPATS
jgi:tetratricopeptide (TPR) repeat protein